MKIKVFKVYLSCLLLFKEEQLRLLTYQVISVPSFLGKWNDVANCQVDSGFPSCGFELFSRYRDYFVPLSPLR